MDAIAEAPREVLRIVERLEEEGFETWAVGGVVRNHLLGHDLGDWDLTTRATPQELMRLFKRTVPIGIDHGTVGVLGEDGTLFEVTTFRKDVEPKGRRAVVEFAEHIEDDLARRDFTINAIAWHPLRKEFLDPFDGSDDLDRRVLRTVGEARERFSEDVLRVLRGLRFAAAFDLTVDADTWVALCDAADQLDILSGERVREELLKVLGVGMPSRALSLYAASGVLSGLYPEIDADADEWSLALLACDGLSAARPILRLTAVLGVLVDGPGTPGERASVLMDRLRFSNSEVRLVTRLLDSPPVPSAAAGEADRRRWLSSVGPELVEPLGRLHTAWARARRAALAHPADDAVAAWRGVRATRRQCPPLTLDDLALSGDDLIAMGYSPGPRFGGALRSMLDSVLDDPARNTAEHLSALAAEILGAPAGKGRS
ncbi:MAG: CCA tRNA nucleotidyltransferase [Gemmatimonadota bacterium]|nr:MAG: CCA tRNA nucleotidyltransferase [Gemmatimonadota bacterium]